MNWNLIKNEHGSILMEYVILIMFVGVPLMLLMQTGFYNFDEGFTLNELTLDIFGITVDVKTPGIMFKHYFQRVLTGISLPIP